MTSRFKALLAGLLLTCSQVHAGVIYSWHQSDGAPEALPKGMFLEIEFSDAAVAAGSVHYVLGACGLPELCEADPASPVLRFLFDGVTPPISYAPASAAMNPFATLAVSVRFEADGYLSGYIAANDGTSQFVAGSKGGTLFSVDGVRSDFPFGGGCDLWGDDCRGATGYLRAKAPVSEVPEPNSPVLLGIAMLGLMAASRRR